MDEIFTLTIAKTYSKMNIIRFRNKSKNRILVEEEVYGRKRKIMKIMFTYWGVAED